MSAALLDLRTRDAPIGMTSTSSILLFVCYTPLLWFWGCLYKVLPDCGIKSMRMIIIDHVYIDHGKSASARGT